MKAPVRIVPKPLIRNETTLKRVISGAQIGVDIAALRAAKKMGFRTGGSMPTGFITLDGKKPGYSFMYEVRDNAENYKTRTWANVRNADATIRLATDFISKGEVCTLSAVRAYQKPLLDIYLEPDWVLDEKEVAYFIISNGFRTINISGNADKELEQQVEDYLIKVFKIILYS